MTEALGWARERGLSAHDDLSYLREFEHIILARVLMAEYEIERADRSILEAMGLLERLRDAAEAEGRMGQRDRDPGIAGACSPTQGDTSAALAPAATVIDPGRAGGLCPNLCRRRCPMARLLSEAAAHGIMPEYTGKLLAAFEAEAHKSEDKSYLPPAQLPSPLSSH